MNRFSEYALPSYQQSGKRRKRTKRQRRRKWACIFVVITLVATVAFVFFQRNATRVLISISEATMRASTTVAVNDAVYYTLSDEMRYEDLVTITRDEQGAIVAVAANPLKINKIARDTASISQSNLKNLSLNGIPVPLGALTGIEALAGLGPSIHFRIIPVSSVSCDFSSTFESVGINQTKHSIYLNVVADISIVMPSRTENFAVVTEILVGESIIVGNIPDAYLQSDIFGEKPNLSA
ncbi:MAG: sporulation protein YunB [Clostridiales bacterium]|nr:sporulation protein YunB [Clostridiales bacterium]